MDAAGSARLGHRATSAARRLEFGHVGQWSAARHHDLDDNNCAPTVAVEIDPGDGSSLVVFVPADDRGLPSAFQPDDQVCLVLPEGIAAVYPPVDPRLA
ncbi:hypothetical protein [Nocardia brasiliensis]|uniref:Uncharacterized protein n=1 Tax=Nocardia brasiliensis (strain ATCC 700358 / HUJEG-1) TaxID=1133849 RepID=K0EN90_NOCB7|nr:hypothetical protein [Nocardia brasiliensis]AFT98369.1 hypothetical protein O3I_002035 [Nocardia brasiliensis ATCC 700358]